MKKFRAFAIISLLAAVLLSLSACRLLTNIFNEKNHTDSSDEPSLYFEEDFTDVTLKPADGYQPTAEEWAAEKAVLEMRLGNSVTSFEVNTDVASNTVTLHVPRKIKFEDSYDYMELVRTVSQSGRLTFRVGESYKTETTDPDGKTVYQTPTGESETVLMDGSYVAEAHASVMQTSDLNWVVYLTFNDEGTKKFEQITTDYLDQTVSIWLDDTMISSPTINDVITEGEAVISGDFTAESANTLANQIQSGALPFSLEQAE